MIEEQTKVKNPKRVEAGRKGALARKLKKEALLKEQELTKITKDENEEPNVIQQKEPCRHGNDFTKYIPYSGYLVLGLCLVGVGFYINKDKIYNKKQETIPVIKEKKKEIDPFDMN